MITVKASPTLCERIFQSIALRGNSEMWSSLLRRSLSASVTINSILSKTSSTTQIGTCYLSWIHYYKRTNITQTEAGQYQIYKMKAMRYPWLRHDLRMTRQTRCDSGFNRTRSRLYMRCRDNPSKSRQLIRVVLDLVNWPLILGHYGGLTSLTLIAD